MTRQNDQGDSAPTQAILAALAKRVPKSGLAEAQAFAASDPYNQAGLFERVHISAFRPTLGKLG